MTASTLDRDETATSVEGGASDSPEDQGALLGEHCVVSRQQHREFPSAPSLRQHPVQALVWFVKFFTALTCATALLSVAASIPLLNIFALGYLMDLQGRVVRTGKIRDAFYLLPAAQRLGEVFLAVWIWLLPIQFLASAARDSWLLVPGSTVAWSWTGLLFAASIGISLHLILAIGCGGRWWNFATPIRNVRWLRSRLRNGGYWQDAHRALREFATAFRLPQLFSLGLLAYGTVYLWLFVPALLFTQLNDVTNRWQVIGFVAGCLTLTATLLWLPLLQAHVAVKNNWRAMFEFTHVTSLAAKTPFRWALATALLFASSVVVLLYAALLKIHIPPHNARWDVMLAFLVTVIPARVLVARVYHRATLRTASPPTWLRWIWRGANVAAMAVGVGYYVYFLYLVETGGELGQRAVWQFHALLLPLPF